MVLGSGLFATSLKVLVCNEKEEGAPPEENESGGWYMFSLLKK